MTRKKGSGDRRGGDIATNRQARFRFELLETWEAGIALHDPLAVGAVVDPGALGFESFHVEVEHEGRVTRGLTLADLRPIASHRKAGPNCEVAMQVDAPRFLRGFLERLCPASA